MTVRRERTAISQRSRNSREGGAMALGLDSARVMARAWALQVPERQRQQAAWSFIKAAIDRYAMVVSAKRGSSLHISPPAIALPYHLQAPVAELAKAVGDEVAELPIEHAAYQLSATYTALVPPSLRSKLGMYYTPPSLTGRLLDMAGAGKVNWATARVLDPACGGGAFLLPVALRMRSALKGKSAKAQLASIVERLRGFEIDPFAAWLTQTWLEIALADLTDATGRDIPSFVTIGDTLEQVPDTSYDLVIGNPPYGRVTLDREQREAFSRSLYGHANLYGLFTDVALRWAAPGGLIAYVTPPSFLSGQYFQALRSLLAQDAPPASIDFIAARRGVFEDVLQETLLATYRRSGKPSPVSVHHFDATGAGGGTLTNLGSFKLPENASEPWVAPRTKDHLELVSRLPAHTHRLRDWGYEVSTGPLVWNRFKDQLRDHPGKNCFPIVWAEAITGAGFTFRAELRSHRPYFHIESTDEWLKVTTPCVLLQRTTAKEQPRRLVAAEMPAAFIRQHGAAVVENHLNMIRPIKGREPKVATSILAAVLNTAVVDEAFRCINGSVAVSAFELEALPLPAPAQMKEIGRLLKIKAGEEEIEAAVRRIYLSGEST